MRRVLRHAFELPFHHRLNQQIGQLMPVCLGFRVKLPLWKLVSRADYNPTTSLTPAHPYGIQALVYPSVTNIMNPKASMIHNGLVMKASSKQARTLAQPRRMSAKVLAVCMDNLEETSSILHSVYV